MQCDIVHVGTNNDIELCNHDTDSKTTFPKLLVSYTGCHTLDTTFWFSFPSTL